MFKLNKKQSVILGSNVVVNNIYCKNMVKQSTFKLFLPNDNDFYICKIMYKTTNKDTFEEVLLEMDLDNFVSLDKKKNFSEQRNGAVLFKIVDSSGKTVDKDSTMNFDEKYNLYYTDNYVDTKGNSEIHIQKIDDDCLQIVYSEKIRFFLDDLINISSEDDFKKLIYGLNKKISVDFKNIDDIIDKYYIEEFTIDSNTIIDNKKPFTKDAIKKITKDCANKKIVIELNKYKSYKLIDVNITQDLAKIYKLKDKDKDNLIYNININPGILKSKKKLTYRDIQNIITNDFKLVGITLNDDVLDYELNDSFNITIKGDSNKYFIEPKKCKIQFVSEDFILENSYKEAKEIEFNNEINEDVQVEEYILKKYGLKNDNFEIFDKNSNKIDKPYFKDEEQYTIKITKHVAGITKKKENDDLIFNISLNVNDRTNYKLKNITYIPQFTLKKGSTNDDLTNFLKDNYGIENSWISSIFDDKNSALAAGTAPLTGGKYVLTFNDSENKFVEKNIKNPGKKNITLRIVPKDATNYKLNGISDKITINVPENISYSDFVNEVKKTIKDGKFEIYVDSNKVENGNIDINKSIIIKLLDDCDKLEKNGKKEEDDDNNNNDNNNNNTDDSNTQTKQKKYCECKCGKK